jgi:hypothetical protein
MGGLPLSRVWVILVVLGFAGASAVVITNGFLGGAWLRGLLFGGVLPAYGLYEWLRWRAQGGEVQKAVDQMVIPTVLALGALGWL